MIYYSHINEDNGVERSLIKKGNFSSVVAICGSGERVLSLMDTRVANRFVVVDCNEEAIFLLQLKLVALEHLPVDDYLRFVGHCSMSGAERVHMFNQFKNYLPLSACVFWEKNLLLIEYGILHIGHFERFLNRARPLTELWLGRKLHNIFKAGGQMSGITALKWKLLQRAFTFRFVYRLLGNKDVAFTGSRAELARIPEALDRTIRSGNASSSFIAHLVFKGHLLEMSQAELPPSLQKTVLAGIKKRLQADEIDIEYHVQDMLQFVRFHHKVVSPVFYSISDILSFADFHYLHAVIEKVSADGCCIVGRSFLRNRLNGEELDILKNYGKLELHDDQDSTGMYQVFSLHVQSKACIFN